MLVLSRTKKKTHAIGYEKLINETTHRNARDYKTADPNVWSVELLNKMALEEMFYKGDNIKLYFSSEFKSSTMEIKYRRRKDDYKALVNKLLEGTSAEL